MIFSQMQTYFRNCFSHIIRFDFEYWKVTLSGELWLAGHDFISLSGACTYQAVKRL